MVITDYWGGEQLTSIPNDQSSSCSSSAMRRGGGATGQGGEILSGAVGLLSRSVWRSRIGSDEDNAIMTYF